MALVTDSALAIVAWGLALRLHRARAPWVMAFLFTGAAAFLGGIYHGLYEHPYLWRAVVFAVGIASFFFLLDAGGRALRAFGAAKLVAFVAWTSLHDEFFWVIVDYGVTFLVILALQAMRKSPAAKWTLASIGVSIAGAVVQQSRIVIHPYWFDHNDLYHVIQMVTLWMLYRAALSVRADWARAPRR